MSLQIYRSSTNNILIIRWFIRLQTSSKTESCRRTLLSMLPGAQSTLRARLSAKHPCRSANRSSDLRKTSMEAVKILLLITLPTSSPMIPWESRNKKALSSPFQPYRGSRMRHFRNLPSKRRYWSRIKRRISHQIWRKNKIWKTLHWVTTRSLHLNLWRGMQRKFKLKINPRYRLKNIPHRTLAFKRRTLISTITKTKEDPTAVQPTRLTSLPPMISTALTTCKGSRCGATRCILQVTTIRLTPWILSKLIYSICLIIRSTARLWENFPNLS